MSGVINAPEIAITPLPKVADREDFLVKLHDDRNDYDFKLSLTGTIVAIWQLSNLSEAVQLLVDRLVYSHGTAKPFPTEGYWFDSNISAGTLEQTLQDIINRGSSAYLHPSVRTGLSAELFSLLDGLDVLSTQRFSHPFVRSLDVLSERSQASEDFEREAVDHAHFIYSVSLVAAIIDRFDFQPSNASVTGLRTELTSLLSASRADELTEPLFMVRKLRRQYPIHEGYEVDASGIRTRRKDVEEAEGYFGLSGDPASDWSKLRAKFLDTLKDLKEGLEP
jgi:hypothetical protein